MDHKIYDMQTSNIFDPKQCHVVTLQTIGIKIAVTIEEEQKEATILNRGFSLH
jgi:hypothetical protein